jgi:PAS domain S-box-containing protein
MASATSHHRENLRTLPGASLGSADRFSHEEIAMSADAIWVLTERLAGEHIAQLYSSDTVLIESLRIFTTYGLSRREAVFLVLTPPHRDLLLQRLAVDGLDVGGLQNEGQLLLRDAGTLLASITRHGMPDEALFATNVGEVIERARSGGTRKVRVFGEMVNLLWRSNTPAAIRLEQLWNDLIERSELSLFCAYSTSHGHERFPEALRAAHSHIIPSAMAETSADAIVGHTLDPRIVYWNQGAERLYGYAPDEVIGQPSAVLMPPGHNELPAIIERIRRGELVPHYDTRQRRKDGTVIDVSVAVSPIRTRDNELVGVSVVARDISERKRAEEALARLAAIVDSSEDAIIGKTLDTTIISWNHGAERIYGYTGTEAIGQPIGILLPPGSEDEVPTIMERIRRGEKVEHYETKRQRKDGTIIDVSVTVSPIKTRDGEVIGASAVARDITERKQAESARARIARLEQSQAAHRLLLERVFETQEQERHRIARELHDEAGQLMASLLVGLRALDDAATIDDAKAQSRRLRAVAVKALDEVGRLARGLHSSVLDDHGLAVALQRYVMEYSTTHNIAVDLALDETDARNLLPAVQLAVFRVVQEALTNVVKHAGATAIRVRVVRSADGLKTTIADNGRGFGADAVNAHPEAHLGLQSMRERAAILGGTLRVRSGARGTTIAMRVPLGPRDPSAR